MSEELLPLKGTNYKNLISYQKAEVIIVLLIISVINILSEEIGR